MMEPRDVTTLISKTVINVRWCELSWRFDLNMTVNKHVHRRLCKTIAVFALVFEGSQAVRHPTSKERVGELVLH